MPSTTNYADKRIDSELCTPSTTDDGPINELSYNELRLVQRMMSSTTDDGPINGLYNAVLARIRCLVQRMTGR
jgi:hypothetical protein